MRKKKMKMILLLTSIFLLGISTDSSYGYFNGESNIEISVLQVDYNK